MTAVRLIQPLGRETQPFEDIVDELKFFADMADDLGMPRDDHIYLRSIAEIRRLRALVPVWRALDDVPSEPMSALIGVSEQVEGDDAPNFLLPGLYVHNRLGWRNENDHSTLDIATILAGVPTTPQHKLFWLSEAFILSTIPAVKS